MTILNLSSDGLHSQLIVLARVAAKHGPIDKDELVSVCAARDEDGNERDSNRLRAALVRWLELGLFVEEAGLIKIQVEAKRGATLDELTDLFPSVCRRLAQQERHSLPLWAEGAEVTEDGTGRTADFVRSLSWALAQDIYNLPTGADEIEALDQGQIVSPGFIFLNKTRWPGLRVWARYLGFASGDDANLLFDPTIAVRDELPHILGPGETMAAPIFIEELSLRLPMLDGGSYRKEVEARLRSDVWRAPPEGHLSMSLSMALRRLDLDGVIVLETKADTGAVVKLSGRDFRTWASFTHVRMVGDQA